MIKPLVLVVDDETYRHTYYKELYKNTHEYIEARDAYEAIEYLETLPKIALLHLDYDLYKTPQKPGKPYLKGIAVAEYVINQFNKNKIPDIIKIHSWNMSGHAMMLKILSLAKLKPISEIFPEEAIPGLPV